MLNKDKVSPQKTLIAGSKKTDKVDAMVLADGRTNFYQLLIFLLSLYSGCVKCGDICSYIG